MDSGKIFKKRLICASCAAALAFGCVRCAVEGKNEKFIGEFDMSHYCLQSGGENHLCAGTNYGCGGDELKAEVSLAVGESLLKKYPLGTKVTAVLPDGSRLKLIIQDTGGALDRLGRVDLAVKTHSEALRRGVIKNVRLYLRK